MRAIGLVFLAALGPFSAAVFAADPAVTNVRATQLADKRVEVLYDLAGGTAAGSTVSVAFSADGGATWTIIPAADTVSGHIGAGVRNGASRRLLWSAAATLPGGTSGSTFRARISAYDPAVNELTVMLPGSVPLTLVRIPAGIFMMGSPASERGREADETLHQVTLTQPYYLGKYEVTQAQWQAVMGTAMPTSCGAYGVGPNYPVYCVSWNDIAATNGFVERLNAYLGTTLFRLPTEAEWERAARAGTSTRFSHGDVLECGEACEICSVHNQYMAWCGNTQGHAQPVGFRSMNPFGLYDVHGNLGEWVQDWYITYPVGPATDPTVLVGGVHRVIRGGYWNYAARYCRSAGRNNDGAPTNRYSNIGFRIARSL
ncbi:MAG: formylglycine-generating enzyme family protein [Holophagales bacterium]|nr:MAG: formylglycine-generating enzyme family protein [Holophagales bacterium]